MSEQGIGDREERSLFPSTCALIRALETETHSPFYGEWVHRFLIKLRSSSGRPYGASLQILLFSVLLPNAKIMKNAMDNLVRNILSSHAPKRVQRASHVDYDEVAGKSL